MKRVFTLGRFVIVFVAVIVASQARADGWSGSVNLNAVQPFDSGGSSGGSLNLYLDTTQAVYNPGGCSSTNGYEVVDPVVVNQVLAVALSAITTGTEVELYVSSSICTGGRPTVTAILIL